MWTTPLQVRRRRDSPGSSSQWNENATLGRLERRKNLTHGRTTCSICCLSLAQGSAGPRPGSSARLRARKIAPKVLGLRDLARSGISLPRRTKVRGVRSLGSPSTGPATEESEEPEEPQRTREDRWCLAGPMSAERRRPHLRFSGRPSVVCIAALQCDVGSHRAGRGRWDG
ncbi:hypothetical protein VTI74DRAFT_10313 [Chaetomium olivicolor]